ncbi:DUF58 domain-containing protein [Candidatus Woesearchaeota archaeon]|nr:DUF58 domain-containing protein [Candidatus Woesearchaeota archaeon]
MPEVKEILKQIKKIEIKTNKLVEGLIAGSYKSVFKGRGIEFSEVREYMPGDDIRSIDWNVTARFNTPYVKEFVEERDLNVYIVFDMSRSMFFGSVKTKKQLGIELAAALMFSGLKNNDNIGLCLFTSRVERFVKPRKGKKFVLKLLRDLVYYQPEDLNTNLENVLTFLARVVKKRSILFIISDFLTTTMTQNVENLLRFLKRKHDVILINLQDPNEELIPSIGYALLEDAETGEQVLINTNDKAFRIQYLKLVKHKHLTFQKTVKKLGIDVVQLTTTQPFYIPLTKFFKLRAKRLAR